MSSSSDQQQPAGLDFSFPSLAPPPAQAAPEVQANPFAIAQPAQQAAAATAQQPPRQHAAQQSAAVQPAQVQLQQPVRPVACEPLTARSTVVHASSRAGGAQQPQQQQQLQDRVMQQPPAPKPVPIAQVQAEGRRNKVPLEKGFSQVSWLKLTKSGSDLTGGQGRRKDITLEEVKQHRTPEDAWMVLHGKVYNITPYLRYHPGGADILMKAAGRDGTPVFNKYHPWVNAGALLEKCLVGLLHKPEGEAQPQQQQSLKSKLTSLFK